MSAANGAMPRAPHSPRVFRAAVLAAVLTAVPAVAMPPRAGAQVSSQASSQASSRASGASEVAIIAPQSDTIVSLGAAALVNVTLRSGSLVIRGGDRPVAEVRTDGSAYQLRSSDVGIALVAATATPRSASRSFDRSSASREDARSREGRGSRSRLELLVPRGVRVVVVGTSGEIEIHDVSGDVEIKSSSGGITLSRLGSRAIVETLTGDVRLGEGVGDLRIVTTSGDIEARAVRGTADLRSTSGSVRIDAARATRIGIETISGDIDVGGTVAADARLTFTTHSGDVDLQLASGTRGSLEFQTFTGELNATGPLLLTPPGLVSGDRRVRSTQRFEFGGGNGVLITVTTFSGDVQFDVPDRR